MNVLMISPGYPEEMIHFTRGLAEVGAQVIGVGDQHEGGMDPVARKSLAAYVRVDTLWDEEALAAELKRKLRGVKLDRIECLWEPGMLVAARLREELDRRKVVPARRHGLGEEGLLRRGVPQERGRRHADPRGNVGERRTVESPFGERFASRAEDCVPAGFDGPSHTRVSICLFTKWFRRSLSAASPGGVRARRRARRRSSRSASRRR